MAWSWEVIKRDWLLDGAIAVPPEKVLTAFETANRILGDAWVDRHRNTETGTIAGTAPTLNVVSVGTALAIIEGRAGASGLIQRLLAGDHAAFAELRAIYLCAIGFDVEIEIEPELQVGVRSRKPDFRIRAADSEWTYVEVAAPDIAETHHEAKVVMEKLASVFPELPNGTALDLFLRREPAEDDVTVLKHEMVRLGKSGSVGDHDVSGLAIISVNMSPPSQFEPKDYGDEPYTPRLGLGKFEGQAGSPATKRVTVRYPYSDERAEEFLTREARQLSREQPGLVMLNLNNTPGSFKTWRPLLMRRLQPNLHTRVSGICLFQSGIESTPSGENVVSHTSIIENSHSLRSLPPWLAASLKRFEGS